MPRCLLATPAALAVLAIGAATAGAAIGPVLPAAHVGAPLSAPPPPTVGGQPPEQVLYRWERCWRYGTLVASDDPTRRVPLDGQTAAPAAGALVGEPGQAATFDGGDDVVSGAGALLAREPFTVELWARPTTIDDRYRYLVSQEASTASGRQGFGMWVQRAGLGVERYVNGVKAGVTLVAGLSSDRWSHVVASYDGATLRLFVDGRQVGSVDAALPLVATAASLRIGAGAAGAGGFFAGALDEVAIYDHALSRSHVAAHAAAGTSEPCSEIAGARNRGYTPVGADLGRTLQVTETANRTTSPAGSATSTSATVDPVDEAGEVVHPALVSPTANATVAGTQQVTASVGGLPPDRIEFLIDGVVRYAKDEPPYQYTWYTNAEANGRHTVAVRVRGPGATTTVNATTTVTVSNHTVVPVPLALGKESMYAEFNEGDVATANNLLDDVWPARGLPLPKLGWPLSWREDPYDDAYWRFYHYGLRAPASLLYVWQTTGDRRYLDKLIAILRSFVAYDAMRPVNTLTFDNNHAAAYRAMALVNFYAKLDRAGVLPSDLRAGLQAAFARLGSFLAAPAHFEGGVNHGFNEGAALLLLADNFPTMSGAASWRQTAIERLRAMLDTTLDADGVEVENSPFYHVYVLGLVYQIAQWAERYEPALAASYAQAARAMLRYAAYVVQPSGYLPMLGATATTYLPAQDPTVYGPMAEGDSEFAFAYTRGARGTPPPDGSFLFPASGLFVMRSPLGTAANLSQQTFVTFDAGPYRTEHSDLDALGITMYANGSTVLPESGLFTYTLQPERAYFHGTRAHNTVVVDGTDQEPGAAQAGPSGSAGGSTWARGSSTLYPGVRHARSVVVLRQGLTLVVDRLAGTTTHAYTQTWHLPPDATPSASGPTVTVTNGAGQRVLAIQQADPTGMTLSAIRGQTTPTLQGWYSSSFGAKVPAFALEYTRRAASATFATLLAAGPAAAQAPTVTSSAVAGGTRYDVCVGTAPGSVVTVPLDEAAAILVAGRSCAT